MAAARLLVLSALAALSAAAATSNPIIQGDSLLKLVNSTANGHLYAIDHPLYASKLPVLHVYGSPAEMGRAYGQLMGAEIYSFLTVGFQEYVAYNVAGLDLSGLPAWLQAEVRALLDKDATAAVYKALDYVLAHEYAHLAASPSQPLVEAAAMAQGVCESGAVPACNATQLTRQLLTTGLVPELIRMSCSMMGAWGAATPTGSLVQLRSLDFGGGPLANYTLLAVYHPAAGSGNAFANLGFAGFTGAVTGFSTKVALSEKVWMTYDNPDIQPGNYDGLPDITVIRDMLQFADSHAAALAYAQSVKRTWAVFLGVGDFATQTFRALAYREQDVYAYAPNNISEITHFTPIADVVMVDKHPQPSHDNTTMPAAVQSIYGHITGETTAQTLPAATQSGDLHIAVYDFGERRVYISLGCVGADSNFVPGGEAWQQPFLSLGMDALFATPL